MRRLSAWLGAAALGWALSYSVFGVVREASAQVVPDSVTNKALEGFDQGGYKATAIVALAGVVALGAFVLYLMRRFDKRDEAKDAIIVRLADKLEATSTRTTDIAAGSKEVVEANTRVLEAVKARLPAGG
jgi:hypothetical protein